MELAGTSKTGVTVLACNYRFAITGLSATQDLEYGISVCRLTDVGTNRINPNGDTDLDWMIIERLFATSSGATFDSNLVYAMRLRSRRRCQEMGQTLGLSFTALPPATITVKVWARTLVALP